MSEVGKRISGGEDSTFNRELCEEFYIEGAISK